CQATAATAISSRSLHDALPILLGPGWPGVLLHEAIGHGLEGDFNRKRTSAFTDRIGQRVATDACTVVDDGTLAGRRGSLNVDDRSEEHTSELQSREKLVCRLLL